MSDECEWYRDCQWHYCRPLLNYIEYVVCVSVRWDVRMSDERQWYRDCLVNSAQSWLHTCCRHTRCQSQYIQHFFFSRLIVVTACPVPPVETIWAEKIITADCQCTVFAVIRLSRKTFLWNNIVAADTLDCNVPLCISRLLLWGKEGWLNSSCVLPSLTCCLAPVPLNLRTYGAIEICLLLL